MKRFRFESFIKFIIESPKYGTFTEAARTDPEQYSHDTWREEFVNMENPQQLLWDYVQRYIDAKSGYLIADDTILDKPRGPKIEGVGFHYSGKHKRSVRGLCLVSLVWTDGKYVFPVDFRIYNKNDGVTKNEHLRDMLKTARERGFTPKMVMFDSWYSSCETLHLLQSWSWKYIVGIKSNRVLIHFPSPYQKETIPLKSFLIDQDGLRCRLKGLGIHRCFSQPSNKPGRKYWCTNHTNMTYQQWKTLKRISFLIEHYHRGLKQHFLVEKCQARKIHIQTAYICVCLCSFAKIQRVRQRKRISVTELFKKLHRERIEQSRISSPTCEFLWSSKRCG